MLARVSNESAEAMGRVGRMFFLHGLTDVSFNPKLSSFILLYTMLMMSSESCIFNDNESIPAIDRLIFYPDKKDEIYHLYSSSLK